MGGGLSSRARTDTDLSAYTHKPVPLPLRLHHQATGIVIRNRDFTKVRSGRGPSGQGSDGADLAHNLAARALDRNCAKLARIDPEPGQESSKRASDRALSTVLDLESEPESLG